MRSNNYRLLLAPRLNHPQGCMFPSGTSTASAAFSMDIDAANNNELWM